MRTTKEDLAWLRELIAETWEDGREIEGMTRVLDEADALTTLATAAGLPADASADEVVARVGEMNDALRQWWKSLPGSGHRLSVLARRLAEEAGRG